MFFCYNTYLSVHHPPTGTSSGNARNMLPSRLSIFQDDLKKARRTVRQFSRVSGLSSFSHLVEGEEVLALVSSHATATIFAVYCWIDRMQGRCWTDSHSSIIHNTAEKDFRIIFNSGHLDNENTSQRSLVCSLRRR